MNAFLRFVLLFLMAAFVTAAVGQEKNKESSPDDQYVPGPDSLEQSGVPKGEVTKYSWNESKIYPGTIRDYWVYVPKQYDEKKAACVFVCQDGILYEAPKVFDNLDAIDVTPADEAEYHFAELAFV